MWELADKQIDTFISRGKCEFMGEFATPFAVLVISDLLGVPPEDRQEFRRHLIRQEQERGGAVIGGVDQEVEHMPLAWLYETFSAYIADRRRNPRGDVLTGLAEATFPDNSVPEPLDVARIAANLFAAGQETTVRLLSFAFQMIGEDRDLQQRLREDRSLIANFVEECLRIEGPVKGDFRLTRRPTTLGGVDIPAGTFVFIANGAANRDPRTFDNPGEFQVDRRMPGSMSHSAAVAIPVPAPPWRGPKRSSASTVCSIRPATFASPRNTTGRPARDATPICQPSYCAE